MAVCAREEGTDYIATSDKKFIETEDLVPAKRPNELLEFLGM